MLPYIHILSREIPMYGIMAGVGVLLAVLYLKHAEKRYPKLEADAELAFIYGIVGAFVGAKALFLATVFPAFLADLPYLCTQTTAFFGKYLYAGFVFYGGLYGAVLSVCLYARAAKVSAQRLLNILLPVLPLIHSMGRIGCFCVGCCYGRYSERWGVYFSGLRSRRTMCRCCLCSFMRLWVSCSCLPFWHIWGRKRQTAKNACRLSAGLWHHALCPGMYARGRVQGLFAGYVRVTDDLRSFCGAGRHTALPSLPEKAINPAFQPGAAGPVAPQ